MTTRTATCACGQLSAVCEGEPTVVACNCTWCQRRSGSPYGLGAYFKRSSVRTTGESTVFARPAPQGRKITNHFCPSCGSTVFWFLDLRPDEVGVSVGCFADPSFPQPARAVWTQHQHHWVRFPESAELFERARTVT